MRAVLVATRAQSDAATIARRADLPMIQVQRILLSALALGYVRRDQIERCAWSSEDRWSRTVAGLRIAQGVSDG
jgi:DNA-binding IclR family transcriptional regulator